MHRTIIRSARRAVLVILTVAAAAAFAPVAHAQFVEPNVQVLYTLQAEAPGDFFGYMASAIGDLNGDGVSEFIIGAWRNAAAGPLAGRAYVYSGRDGTLLNVVTGNANNRVGFSVAGVGDVNRDGIPDYAVGGPGRFAVPQNGRAIVLSGSDHSTIYDLAGTSQSLFGWDVNGAGDVNGDGWPDLAVGAPLVSQNATFGGRVYAISGRDGSTIWTRDGESEFASVGTAVGGVGDRDGDGLADVVVGASGEVNGHRNSGKAFLLRGRDGAIARTFKPASTACDFGDFYVSLSDDVNGDGVPDIYLADYCDNRLGAGSGRGYVFSGASDEKLRVFNAEMAGDGLGAGRPVRDLDGDGAADFVISAYTNSTGAPDAGKVYWFSGKTGKVLRTITGTVAGRELGFDSLPIGDVNGDGKIDFLLTGQDIALVIAGDR
ncbi:MAG TPA: integrin alpha [Candidatus Polarisedimenticolia bacterium]|nr:integrin alpha [Candidatus Polarisedimenticolia bacterium]